MYEDDDYSNGEFGPYHTRKACHRYERPADEKHRVWCPLNHPVTDWPLAVCDCRTVDPEQDLEEVDTVLPHRVNEIYHLRHNSSHKWYYMRKQQPNEALIMKICDSEETGTTQCQSDSSSQWWCVMLT